MNGILGFINLLFEEKDLDEATRSQYVEIVNQSGQRLLDTINDIIEISRIEAGGLEVNLDSVNLEDIMKYQYDFFAPQARDKGLEFNTIENIKGRNALIRTDRHKLEGILTNLIKNAIKFTTVGSVEIGNDIREGQLWFYVKDSGRGIPEEKKRVIFDRFIQAEEHPSRPYEGSGLGLSIVHAYIEALGGSIQVESSEGAGSTFVFTLPLLR